MALLEVQNLGVEFYTEEGVVTAVDDLSYHIDRGEKFGIVGESGAGKSVTALALLNLIEDPGRIVNGSIRYCQPDRVADLREDFESHVVDLSECRAGWDVSSLLKQLDTLDISGHELSDDPADEGVSPTDLTKEIGVEDIVNSGGAEELGLIDPNDFLVVDPDRNRAYVELLRAPAEALTRIRGNDIAMIFQDAQTALNPVYTVGNQISEALRLHRGHSKKEAREHGIRLLDQVGIPEPEVRYSDYPHEFSGGMQQRAVIAMALSCDPDILIADEPTTALDVTIEAKILKQIEEISTEFDTAVQLITHDLGVIAEVTDRVMVMYAGRCVERAPVVDLFYDPQHPYTVGLMSSIPRVGADTEKLQTIPGTMPDLVEVPSGCSFHPRCPWAEESCVTTEPVLQDLSGESVMGGHTVDRAAACHAHTGRLTQELDYEVLVNGSPVKEVQTDEFN